MAWTQNLLGLCLYRMRSDRSHRRVILWCVRSSGSPSTLLPHGGSLRRATVDATYTRNSAPTEVIDALFSVKWLAVDATTTGTGVPLGEGPSTLLTSRYFRAGVPVLFIRTIATLWLFFGASVIAETRKRKYTESNNRIGDTRLPQNQMQGHHPIALLFSPSPPLSGVGGMGGSP